MPGAKDAVWYWQGWECGRCMESEEEKLISKRKHVKHVFNLPFFFFFFGTVVGRGASVGSASQSSSQDVANFGGGFVVVDISSAKCREHVRQCGALRATPNLGGTDETRNKCC